jgi:hypothetical protein
MTLTKRIAGAAAFGAALLICIQTSNADNKGKACHASTSSGDVVNVGTYNDRGECCGPRLSSGPVRQFCIVCNNSRNSCADGKKEN